MGRICKLPLPVDSQAMPVRLSLIKDTVADCTRNRCLNAESPRPIDPGPPMLQHQYHFGRGRSSRNGTGNTIHEPPYNTLVIRLGAVQTWSFIDNSFLNCKQRRTVVTRYAETKTSSQAIWLDDVNVIANCWQCCHNDGMTVQITIRGVPDEVRDELAARAALRGQSMQEYLRGELERIATKPSVEVWLERVQERKAAYGTQVTANDIVEARDQDRR